ncbi:MAG TPA: Trk system potassium transporter TrkA [Bacteroidales bacterium]|nr:Trk system potassium transporter TrkA [Bacteroidales bacterium]
MKIIIAGAGEVGAYLAKMLVKEDHDIILIDNNEKRLKEVESDADLLTVTGSCTSIRTLIEAGVKTADLFIAVTVTEQNNTIAAILAKKLGARKTIARIDSMEYLEPKYKPHLLGLGIDKLIYPEYIAAKEVNGLIKQTGTSEIFDFSGGKLTLFVVKLDSDAPIVNKTLIEADAMTKSTDYRVVAISRNNKTVIPNGNDVLMLNDLVYVITNPSGIVSILKYAGKKKLEISNIMILGGSRIGRMVAMRMQSHLNIKMVDIDSDKCEMLANELNKCLIINGDGRSLEFLEEQGIQDMDAFLAVTGNSETNILSCIMAKRMGVKKTIAEVENIDFIDVATQMGIDTIVNKKMSAASYIYSSTLNAEVSSVKCITGSDAEVLEFVVQPGAKITGDIVRNINFPKKAIIGGVVRDDKSFIANGNTLIKANDKVVVFALPEAILQIEDFFN